MNRQQFVVRRRTLSDRLIRLLIRLFAGPGSWRDADVEAFVAQAVPALQGSQRALAALAAAYVADQAAAATGRRVAPPGVPASAAVDLRAGVDTRTVYARPFVELRAALARGESLTRAVELGQVRLSEIAELDLQQTYAHATRAAMQALPAAARPRAWRRVLVGVENCAICVVASTQRYRVENLNPLHPACDCTVEGIWGQDPGQVIEPELLEAVHDAVQQLTGQVDRGARAPDYRHLMVSMTREHGELGALLVRPLDRFTGPADL